MLILFALAMIGALATQTTQTDDRDLVTVDSAHVSRIGPDELAIELPLGRTTPPCDRLSRAVRAEVAGRAVGIHRGGKGWRGYVSPGFPVPMPQRMCRPATVRVRNVGERATNERVSIRMFDETASWTLDVRVPPMPKCSVIEPRNARLAPGDRVRLACAHDDVAALAPRLMLLRGPNPTGTRPPLEFAGDEIAFVVPDDWTQLPDLQAALRVDFPHTTPQVVRADGPKRTSAAPAVGFRSWRDIPVRVVARQVP